jgi:hypothetical protein
MRLHNLSLTHAHKCEHTHTRGNQKVMAILICFKSDVAISEKYGSYNNMNRLSFATSWFSLSSD